MPLHIKARQSELSSYANWETNLEEKGYFLARLHLPDKGDRIILAMAGNSRFFSRLAEFGHVFEVEPVAGSSYTVDGTDGMSENFMHRATSDENRRVLLTVDGENDTIEFVDNNGFLAEISVRFIKETVDSPQAIIPPPRTGSPE